MIYRGGRRERRGNEVNNFAVLRVLSDLGGESKRKDLHRGGRRERRERRGGVKKPSLALSELRALCGEIRYAPRRPQRAQRK